MGRENIMKSVPAKAVATVIIVFGLTLISAGAHGASTYSGNPPDEDQRKKDHQRGDGAGDNCRTDFPGAGHRCLLWTFTVFPAAPVDIFQHDDVTVDHHADPQRKAPQGH